MVRRCLLVWILLLVETAWACSCAGSRPACTKLDGSDSVVFTGTVRSRGLRISDLYGKLKKTVEDEITFKEAKKSWAKLLPKEALPRLKLVRTEESLTQLMAEYFPFLESGLTAYQFEVDETFQGEAVKIREVWTGQGYGDCGIPFEIGMKYLVVTYRDGGKDQTGICAGTREAGEGAAEIEALRVLKSTSAVSRVLGFITIDGSELARRMRTWTDDPLAYPLAGTLVQLKSDARTFEAITEGSGKFTLPEVPRGSYILSAEAPGMQFQGLPQRLEIHPPGCSVHLILAAPRTPAVPPK